MATSPPRSFAGTSPIEKLPAELLEKILLEVVSRVKSPITYEDNGHETLRSEEVIEHGASLARKLLAHRLVSRTTRGCSWRSLGRVVCETVFDLRSAQSFENLIAVSECEELAPWMNKLTVAFFAVEESYPFKTNPFSNKMFADMDEGSRKELLRIRALDREWSVETWRWSETTQTQVMLQTEQRIDLSGGSKNAVDLLTQCINRSPNLDSSKVLRISPSTPEKAGHYFSVLGEVGERGAYLGMHLVTEAMICAFFRPKKLELLAYLHEPHYFNVLVSLDRVKDVFSKVEHLTLQPLYAIIPHKQETTAFESAVTIDRSVFPALHSLTLQSDWCCKQEGKYCVPYPPTNCVSNLERITILYGWQSSPKLLGFLDLFKPTLRSVTLRRMGDVSYQPILTALRSFNLDMLAIYDDHDEWWDGESADLEVYRGVPKEAFDGIAKTLILRPPQKDKNAGSTDCINRNESTENTHPSGESDQSDQSDEREWYE